MVPREPVTGMHLGVAGSDLAVKELTVDYTQEY